MWIRIPLFENQRKQFIVLNMQNQCAVKLQFNLNFVSLGIFEYSCLLDNINYNI